MFCSNEKKPKKEEVEEEPTIKVPSKQRLKNAQLREEMKKKYNLQGVKTEGAKTKETKTQQSHCAIL